MSTNFVNPTYYNLQKAILKFEFSPENGSFDITGLIPSLSINSSTGSETMYGTARVIDSVGLLEETPLRGEEQIILEIADSKTINENGGAETGIVEEPYRFIGFVYKIDNVTTKDANDATMYDIHFVSYQSFKAGTYEIIRSFRDQPVSDIAKTIFDDYYKTDDFIDEKKNIIIEDTDGNIRCTIPRMRPEEAMEFISKRSFSALESPSCTYRFFESSRAYHFVTDEHLFRLAKEDPQREFEFTFLDSIPNTLDYFNEQLNNFESIDNSKRISTFNDIYNGAYRNKVIEIDIIRRETNLINDSGQFDYLEERNRYFDVKEFGTLTDRHTKRFIENVHRKPALNGRNEDVQKTFLVVTNFDRGREDSTEEKTLQAETHYTEIISNRQSYSKHIESITVNAVGPGRMDITAGDIINLAVKKFILADGDRESFEPNSHLSGKYIIRSVNHRMEQDEMKNYYTLVKKDWANETADEDRVGDL